MKQSVPSEFRGNILYVCLAASCCAGILPILGVHRDFELIGYENRNLFGGFLCFLLAAVDEEADMVTRVFTGDRICAVGTVSNVRLVQSCPSSNILKLSKLYLNLCPPLVRSSRCRLVFFFRFLAIAKIAVLLPSVGSFAGICSSFCVHPVSNMSAANIVSVKAGGVFGSRTRTLLMRILADGLDVWKLPGLPFYPQVGL